MQHREISRASVEKAIADGAKSVSAVGVAHGYQKPVSGSVTAKIRAVVPEVADLLSGKAKPVVFVAQGKVPYHGPVYGLVFEAAVQVGSEQGEQPRKDVVAVVAQKTALAEAQVSYALQVFTTPKHQSNQGRSRNAATQRGHVLLVPVVAD